MNRLTRRLALLRAKRRGCWDPDQAWFETAPRTRAARALRVTLRRQQPVLLAAPRWSEAHRFLDDLATDLALGKPDVVARPLSLAPLSGRTPLQAWAWLLQALTEFCGQHHDGPAASAVSSEGFHRVARTLFERSRSGPRRCLLIHAAEMAPMEALTDLVDVFAEHRQRYPDGAGLNLLLCGAVDLPRAIAAGFVHVDLPDFGPGEAREALAEAVGPAPGTLLQQLVAVIGGVPALVDAVARLDLARQGEIAADRSALWRLLGALGDEVRGAAHILSADGRLAQRMEAIARRGPLDTEPDVDGALVRAGLVSAKGRAVQLRAPVFADALS